MNLTRRSTSNWVLFTLLLLLILATGALVYWFNEIQCEPCLICEDCPPCISTIQYAVMIITSIVLLVNIFIYKKLNGKSSYISAMRTTVITGLSLLLIGELFLWLILHSGHIRVTSSTNIALGLLALMLFLLLLTVIIYTGESKN
jgi:hypothetical protein